VLKFHLKVKRQEVLRFAEVNSFSRERIGNLSQSLKCALIADEKSPARISHRIVIAADCSDMEE
jgi:hypothetical protein